MSGEKSAYATLGLRPGAARAEVDEAYRRLIKRYHPDRMGGDCSRAADINQAYTQLRRGFGQPVAQRRSVPVPVQPPRRPRRRSVGWLAAGVVVAAGAVAVANDIPSRGFDRPTDSLDWAVPAFRPTSSTRVSPFTDLDEPLQTSVIDNAIAAAVRFHASGDPSASVEYSRACHNRFRREPNLAWFDSCAAFDEATVTLTGADLFADSGPFNSSSVMARHFGAARMLSGDMLAADSRLHRIRSRVELTLIPRLEEAAPSQP